MSNLASRPRDASKGMPETLRLSLVLGVIAFVVSLTLALVNAVTAPMIEENAIRRQNESLSGLFPDADEFVALELEPVELITGGFRAVQYGRTIGLVLLSNPRGYGGEMELSIGFDADLRVVGLDFLSISETAGIGSKVTEESYWSRYLGLDEFSAVDGVSGATISSGAVRRGVTAASEVARRWLADSAAAVS